MKLYPFQERGVAHYHRFNGVALNGDETGLGKTVQTLVYVKRHLKRGPVVVVCPKTAKETWRRECWDKIRVRAVVLSTYTPPPGFGKGHGPNTIYIINYDILKLPTGRGDTWTDVLIKLKPQLIIIDECHYLRGRRTRRTRAVKALAGQCPRRIALSATAIVNRPVEFYPVLNILRPDMFPSFGPFAQRYCAPKWTIWGYDYRGASNLGELHDRLTKNLMFRRRKADVLKDLPRMTETIIPIKLSRKDRAEYEEAVTNFLVWLAKSKYGPSKVKSAMQAQRLVQLGYLIRLVGRLKVKHAEEWVKDYLDGSEGKLIVFGVHHDVLRPLCKRFSKVSVLVDGSVTDHRRQQALDRFNRDRHCRLLWGNIDAAGVNWSCKSTSTEAVIELPWTPGQLTQAKNRIEGIERGLPGVAAQVYYLVAEDTIDGWLCNLLTQKQKILDQTLDGHKTGELDILDRLETLFTEKYLTDRTSTALKGGGRIPVRVS